MLIPPPLLMSRKDASIDQGATIKWSQSTYWVVKGSKMLIFLGFHHIHRKTLCDTKFAKSRWFYNLYLAGSPKFTQTETNLLSHQNYGSLFLYIQL